MENPKISDHTKEDLVDQRSSSFKKSDFTIFMEEMGDGFYKFYIKSGEVFKKFRESIKNALKFFRFKFLNIFREKSIQEEQYELAQKLYKQNKILKTKLQEIEKSVDRTQEIADQIKDNTEVIMLKIEDVVVIVESQMARIDNIETYMKGNLGSDWDQIKNNWSMYKDGSITRSEFVKVALKKLGKKFFGLFVNVVS
jgi:hypothetical protein